MLSKEPDISIFTTQPVKKQSKPELYFPSVSVECKLEIQEYICTNFPEKKLGKKFYNYDIKTVPDRQMIIDRISFGCKDDESYYRYHVSETFCDKLIDSTSISIIDRHLKISALQVLSNILIERNIAVSSTNKGELFVLSTLSEKDTLKLRDIKKLYARKI